MPADANTGVLAVDLLRAKLHLEPPRVLRRASVIYKREVENVCMHHGGRFTLGPRRSFGDRPHNILWFTDLDVV